MSVVVWDGVHLAADKQGTSGDIKSTCTKIFQAADGDIVAFVGDYEDGLRLLTWYNNGQQKADWPLPVPPGPDDALTTLIILKADGIYSTGFYPILQRLQDPFFAWGSGRELALGALAVGASAAQAVAVASHFSIYCGGGVEVFRHAGSSGPTYEIELE